VARLFLLSSFLHFVSFALFELPWLLDVWKAHHPDLFARGGAEARRQSLLLYLRFYGALLVGLLMLGYAVSYPRLLRVVALLVYAMWVPQIVLQWYRGVRGALSVAFVAVQSTLRLSLPLYLALYDGNVARLQPSPDLAAMLALWLCLQLAVLLTQRLLGPYAGLPRWLRPERYDYHRARPPRTSADPCAICYERTPPLLL